MMQVAIPKALTNQMKQSLSFAALNLRFIIENLMICISHLERAVWLTVSSVKLFVANQSSSVLMTRLFVKDILQKEFYPQANNKHGYASGDQNLCNFVV
jgi:hypothetical protein